MFSCGLVKLILVSFHFWSIKSINIDLHVWNLACLMEQWFLFNNNQLSAVELGLISWFFCLLWKTNEWMCVAISIFSNTVSHMTTHQIRQFIKQNFNLKAHPFLHILIYYKRIFILRYNFFEHLKNIHREYVQKCQNHKNCWELPIVMIFVTQNNF